MREGPGIVFGTASGPWLSFWNKGRGQDLKARSPKKPPETGAEETQARAVKGGSGGD